MYMKTVTSELGQSVASVSFQEYKVSYLLVCDNFILCYNIVLNHSKLLQKICIDF